MPRKSIIKSNIYAYHVYNRCIDRNFFNIPRDELWRIFCEQAYSVSLIWNAHIHALVLMGNHYHMVLSTPDANISDCMCDFQSEIARSISLLRGTDGYRFQSRYRWSILKDDRAFYCVLKYVYQNPIAAGLCAAAEEYPYSSLSGLSGNTSLKFPIRAPMWLPEFSQLHPDQLCAWMKSPFSPRQRDQVRRGLRGEYFELGIHRSRRSRKGDAELLENNAL